VPLFDTYVAVDWSAKATPATGTDSIWIAALDRDGEVALVNPPTRHAAARVLSDLLAARCDRRTLVGVDVGLGYPAGTADLLGLAEPGVPAWRSAWAAITAGIVDDERNRNNRFDVAAAFNRRAGEPAGPFWGCPHGRVIDGLAPTRPAGFALGAYRATERALRASGRRPMSMWQLTGTGSVGSQSLTAIPVLQRLVDDLSARVDVWPFTSGLAVPDVVPGCVVVAEVWPTMFDPVCPPGTVRDAAQVAEVALRFREADATDALARWFIPAVGDDADAVVAEEGWILGP
jgi:precorrin-8X/cobalt-precorrin-8 methylmutase